MLEDFSLFVKLFCSLLVHSQFPIEFCLSMLPAVFGFIFGIVEDYHEVFSLRDFCQLGFDSLHCGYFGGSAADLAPSALWTQLLATLAILLLPGPCRWPRFVWRDFSSVLLCVFYYVTMELGSSRVRKVFVCFCD